MKYFDSIYKMIMSKKFAVIIDEKIKNYFG